MRSVKDLYCIKVKKQGAKYELISHLNYPFENKYESLLTLVRSHPYPVKKKRIEVVRVKKPSQSKKYVLEKRQEQQKLQQPSNSGSGSSSTIT